MNMSYQMKDDRLLPEELIREAGMEFVAEYDAFTREAPKSDSERLYFIAREQGK